MSIPADFAICRECGQPFHRMYIGSRGICIHCEEPQSNAMHFSAGGYGEEGRVEQGQGNKGHNGHGFQRGNSGFGGNKKHGNGNTRRR